MISQTFYEIIAMIVIALVAVNKDKVVAWEQKQWKKFKRWLRRQLRKSDKIVAWAEKPSKNGGDA